MSLLSSIPAEMVTGGVSTVLTFIGSIIASKTKAANAAHQMLIERGNATERSRQNARALQTPGVRWTRRTIALSVVGAVLVAPILAGMAGVDVTTGWTEMKGGFWPFTGPKAQMIWHTIHGGVVLTPLHTHSVAAIIGYYFGASIAENARMH